MSYYQEKGLDAIYHYQTKDRCTMNCVAEKSERLTQTFELPTCVESNWLRKVMHLNLKAELPPCDCVSGHKHCGNTAFLNMFLVSKEFPRREAEAKIKKKFFMEVLTKPTGIDSVVVWQCKSE